MYEYVLGSLKSLGTFKNYPFPHVELLFELLEFRGVARLELGTHLLVVLLKRLNEVIVRVLQFGSLLDNKYFKVQYILQSKYNIFSVVVYRTTRTSVTKYCTRK